MASVLHAVPRRFSDAFYKQFCMARLATQACRPVVRPGTYRRRWRRLKNEPGCHRRSHAFKGLACFGCSMRILSHFSPQHSWNLLGLLLYFLTVVLMRQWFAAQRLRPWHLPFPSPLPRAPTLSSKRPQGLPLPRICPWQTRLNQSIAYVCIPPRYRPPGLSLYAPSPSATQTYPAALLHIRPNLHWTGRPGPKSGTDLIDITQSEPQLTQVRGVRVASTSHSTLKSNRLPHLPFPELRAKARDWPRRTPLRRYTCTLCCSTRRNPSPPVRIMGQSRLMFMLLCLLVIHLIPHVQGAPTSTGQARTWQHKRAYRRARARASHMASPRTEAGGTPVPLSVPGRPRKVRAPPQHPAALTETPRALSAV